MVQADEGQVLPPCGGPAGLTWIDKIEGKGSTEIIVSHGKIVKMSFECMRKDVHSASSNCCFPENQLFTIVEGRSQEDV